MLLAKGQRKVHYQHVRGGVPATSKMKSIAITAIAANVFNYICKALHLSYLLGVLVILLLSFCSSRVIYIVDIQFYELVNDFLCGLENFMIGNSTQWH